MLADDSTVPGLTDATRTLSLAGAPGQWAFPAADTLVGMKVAARGFRPAGSSDVLHAERPDRDTARGGDTAVPRRRDALPDPAQVVAARARRADARDRPCARRDGLPPPAALPARLGGAPARPARAGADDGRGAAAGSEPSPLRRARLLRRLVARAPGAGSCRPAAAATQLARGRRRARPCRARRSRPPRRSRCSRSSGRRGPSSRRPSTSRPGSTRDRSSSTTRRRSRASPGRSSAAGS